MRGSSEIYQMAETEIEILNLPRNACKSHWSRISRLKLLWLMFVEVFEFVDSLIKLARLERKYSYILRMWGDCGFYIEEFKLDVEAARAHVRHEGADIRNFVMMIVDNSGGLK